MGASARLAQTANLVAAVLQVMVPVCLLTCGPESAESSATKHHHRTKVTQSPAHPNSHHSQDPHPADQAPCCKRVSVGVIKASSSKGIAYLASIQQAQLSQLLLAPTVLSPMLGPTLLIGSFGLSMTPVPTLRI